MKKFLLVIILLVALAGGGAWLYLNTAVKGLIERAGTEALGTPVRIGNLEFSLSDKKAEMTGLVIDNPEGFNASKLLKTKSIKFSVGDVSKTLVTLNEVVVDGMSVSYALGTGGTNFDAMRSKMKASPNSGGASAEAPKLIIKKLRIINAELIPAIEGLGTGPVTMPDIVLTDVGTKSKPATAAEVAEQVMNRIINSASNTAIKNQLTAPVNDAVDQAKKSLKGLFK